MGEGLIWYRRCDPLQDLIIDRDCREGSEAVEHTVLPQADHVIMSSKYSKYSRLTQELMRSVTQMSQCWH